MTAWDGNRTSILHSMCKNAERNESRPAHKSGSRAPTRARLTDLPHWPLPPPRSQPIHLASGRAARSRAISRYLGRSRGRAALSRAISERRSRGGTPAQKRKSPVGATGLTCSLGAPPHSAPFLRRWRGPVRRRPARRVHRPPRRPLRAPLIFSPLGVTLALTQDPGDSLPPTSDGLGRFCAPWRLCISRVPACQG